MNNNKSLFILNQILQPKALHLLKYSQNFVTNRPYLKEDLNTVYCVVFCILMDCKHSLMFFIALQ